MTPAMNDSMSAPPPPDAVSPRRPLRRVLLYLAPWLIIILAFATQSYMTTTLKCASCDERWVEEFLWALSDWGPRMLLFPLVWRLARRFPMDGERWAGNLPIHLAGAAAFSATQSMLYFAGEAATGPWWGPDYTFGRLVGLYLTKSAALNLLVYATGVAMAESLRVYRLYRERERRALQLQGELATAHLEVLKGQLQPHFLFNTLNTVVALMRKNPDGAERVISRLGDLLRFSLQHSRRQEVPLAEELEFLDRYLEIQRVRFQDRLSVRMDIAPDVGEAAVPALVLQPLVENAIRHGIEPHAAAGEVRIEARRVEDRLVLRVSDNGQGFPADHGALREGVGLGNTRARLQQLYGDAHRFELGRAPEGGAEVTVAVPFRRIQREGGGSA